MSELHPSPFPTALVLDTSFLRTVGGPGSDPYQTFVEYVRTGGRELYLSRGVVEELTEQHGYIGVDWVDRADTTEWITLVGDVQPGVRVHERLAAFEQTDPDDLRKTDSELPAVGVTSLGSTSHDSAGVLMDDRNAERAISGVIEDSYYEGRVWAIDIRTAIEFMDGDCGGPPPKRRAVTPRRTR